MLLHADNFDIYGGNLALMLNGIYAQVTGLLLDDPDGVSPGKVFEGSTEGVNAATVLRYVLPELDAGGDCGVAFRMWNYTLPTTNELQATIMQWRNPTNGVSIEFGLASTGAAIIRVHTTDDNYATFMADVPSVTAQGWYHTEIKINTADNANNTFEVRIEGATVLAGSAPGRGGNNLTAQIAQFTTAIGNKAQRYNIKDLVVWNGAGTYNNDFLGAVQVISLLPEADVAVNWGLNGGTSGHEILDNAPPVEGQYIYALHDPAPAGPYVCSLTDLPVDTSSVKGVITLVRATKTDGGDGSLQVGLISDGTTGLGANRPITVAQTYWRDVFEIDPATANPWLPGAVNDVNMQIDRTA